jgi:DNA modification methylase
MLISQDVARQEFAGFLNNNTAAPYLFVAGEACASLRLLPSDCIDTVITSPPYWSQREYADRAAIGSEASVQEYTVSLLHVFAEVRRVLKPTGSLWLNLGDVYDKKNLCGVPWRVAITMQDSQSWILRNAVVWNKVKGGPDNAKDKLRNLYEHVFHFVKQRQYYYDTEQIRKKPQSTTIRNGSVVTATGVSGINYRRQIQRTPMLNEEERAGALQALEATLQKVAAGELFDFRMVIRGQQRVTHSDSINMSGRASELERKGYYILPYDKRGSKPSDVWEIIPEDEWRKDAHFAPFPEELCAIPIKATCPPNGIVLDPFAGTGTAIVAAVKLGRRGIGLDISREYLETAVSRLNEHQLALFRGL